MATARRTPSTTSLAKYVRDDPPEPDEEELDNHPLDFCNSFWGIAYGGYEVLLTRLRGASRTTEELKAFWKERAIIEEEYAKKLGKLAKQSLGRDEIGDLRISLDILRGETEKQAHAHNTLAMTMRKELEQPIAEFLSKQAYFKKNAQSTIEKSYRAVQSQESYVKKARQKYEDDCIKINSFTAQATLVQGKELEKIQLKLEKTKQTVQSNERDYSQFSRALADTTSRWEKEWKVFCDAAQDLEEERVEFIKDNMWGYANAISTVCVSDDESCEKLRVALEQVEAEKDVENFVRDYSTGPQIPDPPAFVDFNSPSARQQQQPTWRVATFVRSSTRPVYPIQDSGAIDDAPSSPGRAGIGAVEGGINTGLGNKSEPNPSRPTSAAAVRSPPAGGTSSLPNNGAAPSETFASVTSPMSTSSNARQQTSGTPGARLFSSPLPINASTTSLTPVTSGTAPAGAFRNRTNTSDANSAPAGFTEELKVGYNVYPVNPNDDPQRNRTQANNTTLASSNVGTRDDPIAQQLDILRNSNVRKDTASSVTGNSTGPIGEIKTPLSTTNKAISPSASGPSATVGNTPTAAMMRSPASRSTSPLPVEKVVENYAPRLPGERRSRDVGREKSLNSGLMDGDWSSRREPSPSREIRPGVGAYGGGSRSPSPQPSARSPHHQQQQQQQQQQQAPIRNQTPLGIAIDESGRVAQDALLERMRSQQQNYTQPGNFPPPQNQNYNVYAQQTSPAQYPQQTNRGYTQPPSNQYDPRYQEYPSPNTYGASPNSAAAYNVPPPPPPPPPLPANTHNVDPRVQQGYYAEDYNNQRGYSQSGRESMNEYDHAAYHNYGVTARTPSPPVAPTNQYTEDGKPVLFYVKALYDYQATIDEEFDFQAGDIIAVTSTPEDGWWSGELLDENRRIPGKTIFPSNFVSLF